MSPAGATLKGSLVSLFLPNWHVNVVKYESFLLSFRMWYPEMELVMIM